MEAALPPAFGAAIDARCAHCGSALPIGSVEAYCCDGCSAVATLLRADGLERFYALGGADGPVSLAVPGRDRPWLETLCAGIASTDGVTRVEVDVQGMHCAGCVWLMRTLFDRAPCGIEATPNAALGRLTLLVEHGFDLAAYVDEIERFGYRVGPALKSSTPIRDTLVVRTGIAIGLAANAMMFALAIYLGLRSGPVYELMRVLEVVLAVATVAVGAPVFFRGAIEGLRRGVLHLDLPIAIGMTLALAGTVIALATGAHAAYADTVAVFVALMLLGRWLERRAVSRNRDRLLASEGAGGVFARVVEQGAVRSVRAREVRDGDALLVAPGEIVVVDATCEEDAVVSLDWISGESDPRTFVAGSVVPAGAIQHGRRAIRMRAVMSFDHSPLESLLGATTERDARAPSAFWDRVTRVYVAAVLVVSALAFLAWWLATSDASRALEVATAVLVVTCPCGIGIATPLAYEIVTSALRRRGLFVRRERALDRAADVRRVAFDKTGTLTTGRLEIENAAALATLDAADRAALADLVARSAHPKSEALRRAIGDAVEIREGLVVDEHPGLGLSTTIEGHAYRLGAPSWATSSATTGDLVFSRDGVVVLDLLTREVLRPDAAREVRALAAEGYAVSILSGDARERASAVAERLGLAETEVAAACSPEDKARWIDAHASEPTLFVGDGINDGLAADHAALSGTPAIDRPFLPARTDFFFVTPGLAPIRALLEGGRALRRVAKRNLVFAIAYNALVVSLAIAGLMRPWLAAIAMPASSLLVIAATTYSLRESHWMRGTAWTS
jgi:Cu2+-exporting ATPase